MPSNFKKLVRARMAKTGENWAKAAYAVRSNTMPIEPKPANHSEIPDGSSEVKP